MAWLAACSTDDVETEDVIRYDHGTHTFCIYRSPEDQFYATDGICTHEKSCLADGLVMGDVIECPKHNGRFNYKTGKGLGAPIVEDIKIYPVKVEGDTVFIDA
jgi:3-phenylpropionate/trans-cinnamate dioxygenase ferredoxin subunit